MTRFPSVGGLAPIFAASSSSDGANTGGCPAGGTSTWAPREITYVREHGLLGPVRLVRSNEPMAILLGLRQAVAAVMAAAAIARRRSMWCDLSLDVAGLEVAGG
jgi:hypothetical protein